VGIGYSPALRGAGAERVGGDFVKVSAGYKGLAFIVGDCISVPDFISPHLPFREFQERVQEKTSLCLGMAVMQYLSETNRRKRPFGDYRRHPDVLKWLEACYREKYKDCVGRVNGLSDTISPAWELMISMRGVASILVATDGPLHNVPNGDKFKFIKKFFRAIRNFAIGDQIESVRDRESKPNGRRGRGEKPDDDIAALGICFSGDDFIETTLARVFPDRRKVNEILVRKRD